MQRFLLSLIRFALNKKTKNYLKLKKFIYSASIVVVFSNHLFCVDYNIE